MILHLVSAASWGGEAAGENRALTTVSTGDGGVLGAVTLLKGIAYAVFGYSLVLLRGKPQIWLYRIRR
jgi:hypothetical protein